MTAVTKTDVDIQRDVMEEFVWDPEILVTDVGVEVDSGVVTLTGTVREFTTRLAAEHAAFRVAGVRAVANNVEVLPQWSDDRTDTEIAKAAANVLQYSSAVPSDAVHIKVTDHWVTLSGEVDWAFQRDNLEKAMHHIAGVTGVSNLIFVKQPVASVHEIKDGIERALLRSAEVDADRISVHIDGGHVTLTGTVRSWNERREAQAAVWRSRGVTAVTNSIEVRSA